MPLGYTGKLLRINLTHNSVSEEEKDESYYRSYFGGRGIIAQILLEELDKDIDPLSADNKIVFATGILTGTPVAGSGRHSVGAKSPLTGLYGDGEAGGHWGTELKKAGYDLVIIEGKAEEPVYIVIKDRDVHIKNAEDIWGKSTAQAQEILLNNEGKVRIAQIGIAGENKVKYACIVHDLKHYVGRTGLGAVMGAKNLKAVAVSGSGKINLNNSEKLKTLNTYMRNNFKELVPTLYEMGTMEDMAPLNAAGGLPTRNFSEGVFEGAYKLSDRNLRDKYGIGYETCFACPIKCGTMVKGGERYPINTNYKGPEYETVAAFGSNCGIDDLEIIIKANELCNAYGLDTISTGVTISFVMECLEKGLINYEQTKGKKLVFGNGEEMLEVIDEIAHRKGLGEVLAEGSKRVSEIWGNGTSKYAVQTKGQEFAMHDPRHKKGLGLGYALSTTGADHTHNMHDTPYEKFGVAFDNIQSLGYHTPLPSDELSPKKACLFKYGSFLRYIRDCLVMCIFIPWSILQIEEIVRAVTGWNTTAAEMLKVAERSIVLSRIFNIREGANYKDDILCPKFNEKIPSGPLKEAYVDSREFEQARATYYDIMGWDGNGVPSDSCLIELGLNPNLLRFD